MPNAILARHSSDLEDRFGILNDRVEPRLHAEVVARLECLVDESRACLGTLIHVRPLVLLVQGEVRLIPCCVGYWRHQRLEASRLVGR